MAAVLADLLRTDSAPAGLVFVRHGKTDKADTRLHGGDEVAADRARRLTEAGQEGCRAAAKAWFGGLGCGAALCSQVERCEETARLMSAPEPLVPVPAIYDGLDDAATCKWFSQLGYNSYGAYTKAGAAADFDRYAEAVLKEVHTLLSARKGSAPVAVFGHAVYSSACAHGLARALGASAEELGKIDEYTQGEAE
eukprot:Hpha_TRINITY_DN5826_c0_g1::TRINITY_DN5826_c0_g1_i1::g.45503::m.45503